MEHINGGMQILRDTSFWSYRYQLSSGPQSVTMVRTCGLIEDCDTHTNYRDATGDT